MVLAFPRLQKIKFLVFFQPISDIDFKSKGEAIITKVDVIVAAVAGFVFILLFTIKKTKLYNNKFSILAFSSYLSKAIIGSHFVLYKMEIGSYVCIAAKSFRKSIEMSCIQNMFELLKDSVSVK